MMNPAMTVDDSEFRDASEHYKQLATFWTDILHLMSSKPGALASVGPMRALAANSKKITNEMIEMSEDMVTFSKHLTEYYSQLADTWGGAQKKVNQKMSDIPQDVEQIEALKRVWIDMFDNDFTELFDSPKFGSNYGKLVSKELEIVKHWNNISNTVLQSANLPSKEEIDDVYREIHSLKKRLRLSELELQRLRRAGSSAASRSASGSAPATGVDNAPSDPGRGDTPAAPASSTVAGDGGKPQPQDVQDTPQPTQHRPQHQPTQQPRGVPAQPPQPPAPSRPRDTAPHGGPAEGPARRDPESEPPPSKPDTASSPSAPSLPDRPGGPLSAQNAKNPRRRRRRPRRRLSKSGRPSGPNPPSTQPESVPKPAPVPGSPKDAHTAAVAQHAPDTSSGSLSRPPQDAAKRAGAASGGAAGAPEAITKKKRRRRHRPDRHTRRMQQQQQPPQQQGQSRPSQPQPAADTRPAPSQKPHDVQNPENTNDSERRTRDAGGDSARQNPPSSKLGTAADGGLPRKDGDAET